MCHFRLIFIFLSPISVEWILMNEQKNGRKNERMIEWMNDQRTSERMNEWHIDRMTEQYKYHSQVFHIKIFTSILQSYFSVKVYILAIAS